MTLADIKLIITAAYVVFILVVIAVMVGAKRDPVKSLGWISVIALLPVAGVVLYILFGRNLRKEKKFVRKLQRFEGVSRQHARAIDDNRNTITLLLNNSQAPLTVHNRVAVLNNGKATFAAIIEALRGAQETINIEYYIFDNDRIGGKIARILRDKARAGVEVRFIYDDVGSWGLSHKFLAGMRHAGVEVRCFQPVVFPWLTSTVNYRNHRKIVVVDGRVAFTGGINIADRYLVRRGKNGMWRDTHLQLEGEAVAMLQTVFLTDWYFLNRKEPAAFDAKFYPPSAIVGESPVQIAASGPDSDWAAIMQAFFSAITRATDHIYISSPYFLPNEAILTALKVAALGGIDVRVIIPSRSDSKIVYWATRSYISELLDAGIGVYLYRRGFNHSKVIMIDGRFSSVGTANMDMRSFEDNFEVSAIMYDPAVAAELEGYFFDDLRHCDSLRRDTWAGRPRRHRIYESLARLLSPLL
jgi:cardiolipin synthase